MKKNTVAAFDFDGTLTKKDSLLPFLIYTAGWHKTGFYLLLESPSLLGFLLGIVSRQSVKEKILKRFFGGHSLETVKPYAQKYAWQKIHSFLRPGAMERLEWHQKQGHRCLIVSASVDLYLTPWCEKAGIEPPICSILEIDADGCITGKLVGKNCWGPEKVKRLEERVGPKDSYVLYAYGDSRGDKELLALADHPHYRTLG